VYKIINCSGEGILCDFKLFCAYLSDFAYGFPEERIYVCEVCDSQWLSYFTGVDDYKQLKSIITIASQYLIDRKKTDRKWAVYLCAEMGYGLHKYYDKDFDIEKAVDIDSGLFDDDTEPAKNKEAYDLQKADLNYDSEKNNKNDTESIKAWPRLIWEQVSEPENKEKPAVETVPKIVWPDD